jgi:hypothetical protein
MSNIVQVEQNNLLNGWLGIAAYTAVTGAMKLALATVTGTATTAGTEVTGGSYARQTVVFATPSSGATSNNATINFTSMPAVTVTGIDIYDSAGTPVRRAFGTLAASKTTSAGDTLSFAAGAIAANLTT